MRLSQLFRLLLIFLNLDLCSLAFQFPNLPLHPFNIPSHLPPPQIIRNISLQSLHVRNIPLGLRNRPPQHSELFLEFGDPFLRSLDGSLRGSEEFGGFGNMVALDFGLDGLVLVG